MAIPPFEKYLEEPSFSYSYAISSFPNLWNPNIETFPFTQESLNAQDIIEKIKEKDGMGRIQLLGIYQNRDLVLAEEKARQEYVNKAVDEFLMSTVGRINPRWVDCINRDLIIVSYYMEPNDVQVTREQMARVMMSYVSKDDPLQRLACHPIDGLPNVNEKNTRLISSFYKKLQGKDRRELIAHREEAMRVFVEAEKIKKAYGLTRLERIELDGIEAIIEGF